MSQEAVVPTRFRYVPTLRTKAGEAKALVQLSGNEQSRILPIFQLTSAPPVSFGTTLASGWHTPFALDGLYSYAQTGSIVAYQSLFTSLVGLGLPIVPSVDVGSAAPYLSLVSQIVQSRGGDVVVRVAPAALSSATAWVSQVGWNHANVDLVIDVGHVAEYDPATYAGYIFNALSSFAAAGIAPWKSITLSSSAAIKDAGKANLGLNLVRRLDWSLWNAVAPHVPFRLDFGDFGSVHRDLTEPPGAAMAQATVSVRYTIDDYWIFIKGRQTGGAQGIAMGQQYFAHAQALVQHSAFGGLPTCWADGIIRAIASGAQRKAGSRATWSCQSMNRHLSKVANQLP